MGVERYDDSLGAWQFVHFSSTCGATQRIAILLEAQNYWPRPERLLIGLHRKPNGARGQFSFSAGERKIMNHCVVRPAVFHNLLPGNGGMNGGGTVEGDT